MQYRMGLRKNEDDEWETIDTLLTAGLAAACRAATAKARATTASATSVMDEHESRAPQLRLQSQTVARIVEEAEDISESGRAHNNDIFTEFMIAMGAKPWPRRPLYAMLLNYESDNEGNILGPGDRSRIREDVIETALKRLRRLEVPPSMDLQRMEAEQCLREIKMSKIYRYYVERELRYQRLEFHRTLDRLDFARSRAELQLTRIS